MTIRVGFMASHRATSARAIFTAAQNGALDIEPRVLISNNRDSAGLSWAHGVGMATGHLSALTHPDPHLLDVGIADVLARHDVDLVILSGYMKKLGPATLSRFKNRILNIHPALLPAFGGQGMYGRRVHEAVIASGDETTGISVHLVDANYDQGPVIHQAKIAIHPDWTADDLQHATAGQEPHVYIDALSRILNGEVDLDSWRQKFQ